MLMVSLGEGYSMDLIGPILGGFFIALILIYPVRKIFDCAGLNPNTAFWLFVPFLGVLITASILAFTAWPAMRNDEERME